jgi:hypothetical protein
MRFLIFTNYKLVKIIDTKIYINIKYLNKKWFDMKKKIENIATKEQMDLYKKLLTEIKANTTLDEIKWFRGLVCVVIVNRHGLPILSRLSEETSLSKKELLDCYKVSNIFKKENCKVTGTILRAWKNIGFEFAEEYLKIKERK